MKKYIISCDDSRYAACLERIPAFLGEFERINITPESNQTPQPSWFQAEPTRWALTCAYIQGVTAAMAANEPVLFFEDDVVFRDDFQSQYEAIMADLPEDWDMLYLGGQLLASNMYPVRDRIGHDTVKYGRHIHRMHAWMTNVKALEKVYMAWTDPKYPGVCTCDWIIGYLHLQPDFNAYIPSCDWICGQGENDSSLTLVHEPERWWFYTEPRKSEEITRINAYYAAQKAAKEAAEEAARRAAWLEKVNAMKSVDTTEVE